MAKYKDAQGNIIEVGSPELNPELVAGRTLVPDTSENLNRAFQENVGTSTLNSDIFKQQTKYNFGQPKETTYSPASTADAKVEKTATDLAPVETDFQKQLREITEGNLAGVGKSAFETQQRQAEGFPDLIKSQEDIANQILMLQAQDKNLEAQMQKESEGRGITVGGLAPHSAAARRDLGIQANILSAQLAASQGKLASAQARIAQAVQDKFGPQEELQKAKIANLELLAKDPALSKAEKDRTNAQLQIQKQKEAEITLNKQTATDVWNISVTAAANQANFKPTTQYLTPATALKAIQEAKTKEEALAIASEVGLTVKGAQTSNQIIGSADTGYSNVITDANGKVISITPISGWSGGGIAPTNFIDVLQASIDADASPEQAAREAATVSEGSGIQVDQKTLNQWTEIARKLKRTSQTLAITPAIEPVITSTNLNQYKVENGKLVLNPDYKPPQAELRAGIMNPVQSLIDTIGRYLFP